MTNMSAACVSFRIISCLNIWPVATCDALITRVKLIQSVREEETWIHPADGPWGVLPTDTLHEADLPGHRSLDEEGQTWTTAWRARVVQQVLETNRDQISCVWRETRRTWVRGCWHKTLFKSKKKKKMGRHLYTYYCLLTYVGYSHMFCTPTLQT